MIKIEVTERDIKKGLPGCPGSCPIAWAAKRALQDDELTIGPATITIQLPEYKKYYLPQVAVNFIRRFDNGQLVDPFSFTIDDEDLSQRADL